MKPQAIDLFSPAEDESPNIDVRMFTRGLLNILL